MIAADIGNHNYNLIKDEANSNLDVLIADLKGGRDIRKRDSDDHPI